MPQGVGTRDMGDIMIWWPFPGNDRIFIIFLPRSRQVIRVGEADATRRIMWRVIEIILSKRFLDPPCGGNDGGKNDIIMRPVAQSFIIQHDAFRNKVRQRGLLGRPGQIHLPIAVEVMGDEIEETVFIAIFEANDLFGFFRLLARDQLVRMGRPPVAPVLVHQPHSTFRAEQVDAARPGRKI